MFLPRVGNLKILKILLAPYIYWLCFIYLFRGAIWNWVRLDILEKLFILAASVKTCLCWLFNSLKFKGYKFLRAHFIQFCSCLLLHTVSLLACSDCIQFYPIKAITRANPFQLASLLTFINFKKCMWFT